VTQACEWLERSRPYWESGEFRITYPRALSALGLAWVYAGRLEEGLTLLDKPIAEGSASSLAYDEALAMAESLGMRPTAARCRLGPGTLLARAGLADCACDVLAQAVQELRSTHMTLWLERAERELARLT